MAYKVAVVGATGNVGREMLSVLAERQFPVSEVVALASTRSVGTDVSFDVFYRPLDSQNVIVRVSAARLLAASATRELTGGNAPFSAFLNLILTY